MTVTTISSRDFNQDVSKAKRAASMGPVFITDRGEPAYVLLALNDYQKITKAGADIVELLSMPEAAKINFKPPKLKKISHPADLS